MSDRLERLKSYRGTKQVTPEDVIWCIEEIERLNNICKYARNEIKDQKAEIERLNCALTISRGKHENAIAWNAKLQAVVDAAREYISDHHNDSEQALFDALAALDTEQEPK